MNRDLTVYLRTQAAIAAAINLCIGGMIAYLIHRKSDLVPTDAVSMAIDLLITCLLTFAITTPFCRASLRRYKTGGVLPANTSLTRLLARLSRRPALLSASLGLCAALILSALAAPLFALLGVVEISSYPYIALKGAFSAALGAFATCAVLYAGMCRTG